MALLAGTGSKKEEERQARQAGASSNGPRAPRRGRPSGPSMNAGSPPETRTNVSQGSTPTRESNAAELQDSRESPNIEGTTMVPQQIIDQIFAMGMENAIELARSGEASPEMQEAVNRFYLMTGEGANRSGSGQRNFNSFRNSERENSGTTGGNARNRTGPPNDPNDSRDPEGNKVITSTPKGLPNPEDRNAPGGPSDFDIANGFGYSGPPPPNSGRNQTQTAFDLANGSGYVQDPSPVPNDNIGARVGNEPPVSPNQGNLPSDLDPRMISAILAELGGSQGAVGPPQGPPANPPPLPGSSGAAAGMFEAANGAGPMAPPPAPPSGNATADNFALMNGAGPPPGPPVGQGGGVNPLALLPPEVLMPLIAQILQQGVQ